MLDILELEKRWFHYRIKKLLPFLISIVVLLLVGIATSYLYVNYPGFIKDIIAEKQEVVQSMPPAAEVNVSTKPVPVKTKPAVVTQNVLKPSLTFMYNIEDHRILPLKIQSNSKLLKRKQYVNQRLKRKNKL